MTPDIGIGIGIGIGAVTMEHHARPCPEVLAEWDALVASIPGTDVTQLSVWARVRAAEGFSAEYVFVRCDGHLVGGAQVLLRRISALGRVGYVAYGPLLAASASDRHDVVEALAGALASLRGTRMLFVQPPEHGEEVRAALLQGGFRPSSAGIAPAGSVRLDLGRSEDEIRRGFPPRLRSLIRRCSEQGVRIRVGDEADVPILAALMRLSGDACGYRPPGADYLRHLYAELTRTGNAALFVGEVRGVPVTADIVTMCGSMVRGRFGGFDRTGEGARLGVPGVVRWEIIQWAQRAGYRWLDFGGLSEQTLHDAVDEGIRSCGSWPGGDRAKMRFGGGAYRYPGAVELIRPAPVRYVFDAVSAHARGRSALHRAKVTLRNGPRHRFRSALRSGRTPHERAAT